MSVQTLNLAPAGYDNATFRAWGSGIAAGIVAAGITKTTDTGQIDWTTVAFPSTTLQKRGYEIYRFNDALQATRPVFMRIDYGSGSYQYNPMMWLTVGTATDGAGNITAHASFPNSIAAVRTLHYNTGSAFYSATPQPVYVDSDGGGSLMVAGWFNVPGSSSPTFVGFVTIVERTRNFDGTMNGEGVMVLNTTIGGAVMQNIILTNAATYSSAQTGVGAFAFYPIGTSQAPVTGFAGGVQNFYPVFTGFTPQMHAPTKHVVGMVPGDMPVLSQFDITHYGALKHWIVTNSSINSLTACVRIT
jgi:hypothetical protein